MLRIQKKYKFNYRVNKMNADLVPGRTISFTSYPASIHSQDDFYQIFLDDGSKVTLTGTALNTKFNKTRMGSDELVLLGPRVMSANRLADNGKSWSHFVSKYNSGTGNKQWLHVHSRGDIIKFWVLEQAPKIIIYHDETNKLYSQRYWISCGISHYKVGSQSNENMEQTASDKIVNVLQNGLQNVSDVQSLLKLMRGPELALAGRTDLLDTVEASSVSHKHFPQSKRTFTATAMPNPDESDNRDGNNEIAIKYVMNFNNSESEGNDSMMKYNTTSYRMFPVKNLVLLPRIPSLREVLTKSKSARKRSLQTSNTDSNSKSNGSLRIINGIIDLKVAKDDGNFIAAAGPPFNLENKEKVVEPFQWSKSRINYLPHNGHSDVWDFQPVTAGFVWD